MTVALQPEPIAEDEYYDPRNGQNSFQNIPPSFEPVPGPFHDLPVERPEPRPEPPMPGPKPKADATPAAEEFLAQKMRTISVAIDILSFRLILLVCVIASAVMFGLSILWPDPWRLASAAAFSVIVTAPVIYFYRKAA